MAKQGSGITKKLELSEEMAEFMGKDTASRAEVVKKVWAYIKKEDLQHPDKKRIIVPDDVLGELVGSASFDMMKLAGKLSKHFV